MVLKWALFILISVRPKLLRHDFYVIHVENHMESTNRPVVIWLSLVCFLIFSMVIVGGITRLTHSGLSIAEWAPVVGTLPPLNEQAWQESFNKYQATPEYLKLNLGMSLGEYKSIFFWEYFHRLLGRITGLVLIIPYFIFLLKKKFVAGLSKRLLGGLLIAGLEGPMGWLMVKSGLVDAPHVSHYRLAAHLALAFILFGYLFMIILGLTADKSKNNTAGLKKFSLWICMGLSLEVVYGAFTAGLKAGFVYNTFPTMNGYWIPPALFYLSPLWRNFFENQTSVQFLHRLFAFLLLISVVIFRIMATRFSLTKNQKRGTNLLLSALLAQIVLGVTTLLCHIPVPLAVAHQGTAMLLFAASLFTYYSFSKTSGGPA